MREDVTRRKALSLLVIALGVPLAMTEDAEAESAGTKSHHTKHPKRSTVQPASAPADEVPAFQPTKQPSSYQMEMQHGTGVRPPEHLGEKQP